MNNPGHPKGLYLLFVTEMAERFSYYGMRALFVLYLVAAFFDSPTASEIYGSYTGLVYLTPLIGGYVADRYWGNRRSIIFGGIVMAVGQFLMFASACCVKQSIMADGGVVETYVDNSLSLWLLYCGLAALILGNGFFKPNISTMVGDLYDAKDKRRDSAFTIFYMGINLGAFMAPFVCGTLGTGDWANPGAFKWGFFSAGCAMVVSVVVFVLFKNRLLVTPEGIQIGSEPKVKVAPEASEAVFLTNSLSGYPAESQSDNDNRSNSPIRLVACIIAAVALFTLFAWTADDVNDIISAAIFAVSIALPVFIITDRGLTLGEKKRIGVIYVIAVFVIFFWSAFEQAGSSLTIFADRQCDRHIGGWEMPTTWFQSINPVIVVVFAPIMAMVWEFLLNRGVNVPSTIKQAMGLALLSLGYFVISFATRDAASDVKVSMWWLFALYFLHTIGELCLSPIGLSLVTKLSPVRLASLLMGVWFMSNAASNVLAGKLASLLPVSGSLSTSFLGFQIGGLSDFFMLFAVMSGLAAVLLLCLCPMLGRMMSGKE